MFQRTAKIDDRPESPNAAGLLAVLLAVLAVSSLGCRGTRQQSASTSFGPSAKTSTAEHSAEPPRRPEHQPDLGGVRLAAYHTDEDAESERPRFNLIFPEDAPSGDSETVSDPTQEISPKPSGDRVPAPERERDEDESDEDDSNPQSTEDERSAPVELPRPDDLTPTTPIGLLISRAVARSPVVVAARHRAAAALQRIPQVRSYDDPRLGTTYAPIDSNSLQTAGGRIPLSLTLSQRMPWRDKLDARGQVAFDEAQRLSVLAAEAELQVTLEVERAAADVWYADRAIEIAESNRQLLSSLEEVAKARVRSGASQQDVLAARLEADRLSNRIAILRRLRGVATAQLAALLGEPANQTERLRIELPEASDPFDADLLIDQAIRCRPELKSRLLAVRRDRGKRRLACLERYPDFDVGLGWQSVTRDEAISPVANGHDNLNLMIGVTLPVWHSRIDAGIREAEQQIFASSREYDAQVDAVRRDVLTAAVRLQTLADQLELYESALLPRSEQVLEVSLADYRGGKVTFVQLTQNYLATLALQTEAARLRSERFKAMAQLRRAVGCDVEERSPGVTGGAAIAPPLPLQIPGTDGEV